MAQEKPQESPAPSGDQDGPAKTPGQSKPPRGPRRRHRGAHSALLAQMEFYFSDANVAKSPFMAECGAKDAKWVDLDVFAKFNKLTSMMAQQFGRVDLDDLWKALTKVT